MELRRGQRAHFTGAEAATDDAARSDGTMAGAGRFGRAAADDFLALAASVRHAGIVRSDAAQRLSLLISLLAAFVMLGEKLDLLKGAGIGPGLLALLCMVWRSERVAASDGAAMWAYPLIVLAGFAAIDILFKRVAQSGLPLGASLQAVFALSLVVALVLPLWHRVRRRMVFMRRSALAGMALGLANFGNILFYLRAHRALPQYPALIFASTNIGVVALGALVGVLVFRERLSRLNLGGVLMALAAIGMLAWR